MPEVSSLESRLEGGLPDIDDWLEQFETAWGQGTAPSLAAFLPPSNDPARRQVLHELIKIDLEYRWSRARQQATGPADRPTIPADTTSLPCCPLLEDYVAHFPELSPLEALPLELIAEEYRVRHRWGDRPDHAAYAARFAQYAQLERTFSAIDNELAAEAAGSDPLPAAGRNRQTRRSVGLGRRSDGGPATKVLAASPPPTGTASAAWPVVPGYEIVGELGRGGMGLVYRARQLGLNRWVALKMILAGAQAGAEQVARFRAEAEAQARLHHPHIVQIYEIGESDGRPYFALELVDGGSLAQKLGGIPQPARPAAQLVETLARAVHVAHGRGLVHRDLKPANILLTADGTPKISDFGLAKRLEGAAGQTISGTIVGTAAYMAPEQAAGQSKTIGPAADVYAHGVILYEMLTGRPPFLAETALDTLLQVRSQEPVPPRRLQPKVPRDLETICLKCLQKEPGKRYADAQSLADDLRRWLLGEPIRARPTPLWLRGWKWARRRPASAALLAVSAFSALFLLAVIVLYDARLRERNADLRRRQQTREALDLLSSQVIDEWLARQKELSPEQRQFLEKALGSYEELARDTGQEEADRAGAAWAHGRVGRIRKILGLTAEAEVAYRHCRELYQRLAIDFPSVAAHRQNLAACYCDLATLLMDTGRAEEAEGMFPEALKLQQQLVADFPAVPAYRQGLATSYNNLGNLLLFTGHAPGAEDALREGLQLQQQLTADFPSVPAYRQQLARSHNNLAAVLKQNGRAQDAERGYRNALKLQQQLVADFPAVRAYREEWAMCCINLGAVLLDTDRLHDAENAFREAQKICYQLTMDFPGVPAYRQELATSYDYLGNALRSMGRAPEAEVTYRDALHLRQQLATECPTIPDYQNELAGTMGNLAALLRIRKEASAARQLLEQAVTHHQAALKANRRHPVYRQFFRNNRRDLAETLVELGEHAAAADTADELLQANVDPATDHYDAACIFARCAPVAERDSKLPDAECKRLAQTYADRAMTTLRLAVRSGFKNVAHMKKDPDLDPLRSREDFQQLLADLATNPPH